MNKIFSGIRPSGKLHLGNYLGAIKNWIALQDDPQTERAIYAVVDLHGITTPYDPATFTQGVMDAILDYLAAGVDPKKSLLVRQSRLPHAELCWLFNTITPVSWLDRLPTYQEKLEQTGGKYNHMGILDYPVLMAADILLYKSNLVPVGEDQKAHIDLTNEIAKKFNSMFGQTFDPVKMFQVKEGARPVEQHRTAAVAAKQSHAMLSYGARIMSLKDPSKKMSKTGDEGIALSDDPDAIREKIKKATTDSGEAITFDPEKKPAISNLLTIYHLLSGETMEDIVSKHYWKNYSEFKTSLAEVVIEFLRPFQEKRAEFAKDLGHVELLLKESEEKALVIANQTLVEVKEKMGLL